ncbi:MAG TPA: hypothetical protein GX702_13930 [Chloroflexi bacterium]|nr:hypothetical protein [Chloroflexota bacterium]
MRDRSRKERLVREWAGRDETRRRPFVLVATQVVEVSLDIDLDVLYSEPAPLEALVQRFGRINRRRLQKELAPVYVMRKPDDGQHVYKPAQLISRTLELLERENGNPIDESAIGCWLDEIYEGELAKEWQRDYIAAEREFEVACLGGLVPFQSSHHLEVLFSRAFDGIDVLPKCLEDEYEQIKEENPILAQELVCTISYGRLCQLRRAELTWEDTDSHHGPIPIEVPYDDKIGLDLSILRQQDDDDGDDF